jgi:hypothetical protein
VREAREVLRDVVGEDEGEGRRAELRHGKKRLPCSGN